MEEVEDVAGALNAIYINVRGQLDNLAWAAIDLFDPPAVVGITPSQVSLLGRLFHDRPTFGVYPPCIGS